MFLLLLVLIEKRIKFATAAVVMFLFHNHFTLNVDDNIYFFFLRKDNCDSFE